MNGTTYDELEMSGSRAVWKEVLAVYTVRNSRVSAFMVYTMMLVDNNGYYSFAELNNSTYFFPFQYAVEKELLLGDSRFAMNNFGGELSISLNA